MGVWIETSRQRSYHPQKSVTPFVGVWIETVYIYLTFFIDLSHPSWVCGLKRMSEKGRVAACGHTLRGCVDWNIALLIALIGCKVTPFVGVWIETIFIGGDDKTLSVTPFVGVWIETAKLLRNQLWGDVTPFVGVWIETDFPRVLDKFPQVTPFVGVWIETPCWAKNRLEQYVTPFVGVWIETLTSGQNMTNEMSHPSWVCGLKLLMRIMCLCVLRHTLRGCVDWNFWAMPKEDPR